MIQMLDDLPDDVVGFEAIGEVTSDDFHTELIPVVNRAREHHEKIRAVCVIGDRFERFTTGAMWADATIGLEHPTMWERIALVTDLDWVVHLASGFGWAVPGELKVFPLSALSDARTWVAERP
jgi:hypothetical protein